MKILIADDHRLLLEIIRDFMELNIPDAHITAVTTYSSFLENLQSGTDFNLAILDYRMPDIKGVDTIRWLVNNHSEVRIAVMSGMANRSEILECINVGAIGFLSKTLSGQALLSAINLMLSGEKYIPAEILLNESAQTGGGSDHTLDSLTIREHEVLRKLHLGYSNKEIGRSLKLEEITVKVYVSKLCKKLNAKNRTQLVIEAMSRGLLD